MLLIMASSGIIIFDTRESKYDKPLGEADWLSDFSSEYGMVYTVSYNCHIPWAAVVIQLHLYKLKPLQFDFGSP